MSKDVIKAIRFDEEELEYLEKKSKKAKRKLSDFMRCELLKDKNIGGWNKK
jgi:hypothetical protein